MAKPTHITLPGCDPIPILYEDRSVLAIDKPPGWMLVPFSWQRTSRNLQAALSSSIAAGHFWARSRGLTALQHVHRLDAETSGVLLFAKSTGASRTYADLFEERRMEKVYLAVTNQKPPEESWICRDPIAPVEGDYGRMELDITGKESETAFRVVASSPRRYLIEARPMTGRTHQIRLHLTAVDCAIEGDELYGEPSGGPMGLRAVGLAYHDPFTRKPVAIRAPVEGFLKDFGFEPSVFRFDFRSLLPRIPSTTKGSGTQILPKADAKPVRENSRRAPRDAKLRGTSDGPVGGELRS